MAMTREKIEERTYRSSPTRHQFPWVLALVVFAGILGVAYSFHSDRSMSERNGVLSETDADNDVIPSIGPQQ